MYTISTVIKMYYWSLFYPKCIGGKYHYKNALMLFFKIKMYSL